MEADYEIEICREKMAFLVQKRRFWSSGLSFVGGGGSARYHRLFGGGDFHPEDPGRRIRNLDRTPLNAQSWPGIAERHGLSNVMGHAINVEGSYYSTTK